MLLRPAIGGAETLVDQLSQRWRAQGHVVDTVYVDPDGRPGSRVQRVLTLERALRRTDPDVVHAHSALPNLYARLATRGRRPVVTVLHSAGRDFDTRSLRLAEQGMRRWTSHVVAVSPVQVEEYDQRIGNRVPVSLIPNGVRADIVGRTVPAPRVARVAAVSRLDPQKRLDVLLAGWRLARPDAELNIAGVASDERDQRQVEVWASGTPSVHLLGRVHDVPGLLATTDLLVHTADAEAHPLAPLEAACAGLPVVVSRAVAATLPRDLAAVTFATGDADDLAAALRRAVAEYPRLAREAVDRAPALARQFSLTACADRHLDVLRLSARPRGRHGGGLLAQDGVR